MTGKTTDNKHWTDPKDFGLPYVEVVPLKRSYISKSVEERALQIDVDEVKKKTIQAVNSRPIETEKTTAPEYKIEEKKSSNAWIWIAAAVALAAVLVIVWQMNNTSDSAEQPKELLAVSTEAVAENENEELAVNSTPSDETQQAVIQDSISKSTSSPNVSAETPQTGTTIDRNVSGSLVRITEKASRPYFYIIVGSLPNEEMAVKEASQYMDRAETVYLIMPYEDVPHYRLAIAGSIGFTAMTEELARVKDQYTEDLWILKY